MKQQGIEGSVVSRCLLSMVLLVAFCVTAKAEQPLEEPALDEPPPAKVQMTWISGFPRFFFVLPKGRPVLEQVTSPVTERRARPVVTPNANERTMGVPVVAPREVLEKDPKQRS